MRKVAVVGAGVTKFGVRKASYRDLIWEAGKACFDSVPGVKPRDLEGLVVGSVMPERTAFQSHISSMAAEALGIKPSALSARTEHMCASGTVGTVPRTRKAPSSDTPITAIVALSSPGR